jgi:hypothetical protein
MFVATKKERNIFMTLSIDPGTFVLLLSCDLTTVLFRPKVDKSNIGKMYFEADIKDVIGFLVDSISVVFRDQVFKQCVGIPIGTNCAPLFAGLFLYSYEADFVQNKNLSMPFNHTYM